MKRIFLILPLILLGASLLSHAQTSTFLTSGCQSSYTSGTFTITCSGTTAGPFSVSWPGCSGTNVVTCTGGAGSFTLTTTGSSGPATYAGGVLNIPQYTGGGMVYPGAGIANSTGSAWGTPYSATNLIPTNFLNLSTYQTSAAAQAAYSGIGACTNQVITGENANAAPSCSTVTTAMIGTLAPGSNGLGTGAFATIADYLTTASAASTYAPLTVTTLSNLTTVAGGTFGTAAFGTLGSTGSNVPQLSGGLLPVSEIPAAIPIANIGSAGLSGTSPIIVASTGAISCPTCGTNTGTVSSFAAPFASWPSWLVPTVTTPTSTPSLAVAAGAIPNSALANSSTTVNGQACALGSPCTIPIQTNGTPNTSQAGLNLATSTGNATGLVVTPTNYGTNQEGFEITGAYNGLSSAGIYASAQAYCSGGVCANGNGHFVIAGAGITISSSTVTCATCNFSTNATVGQIVFATNLLVTGFSFGTVVQLPQGTITAINSNTQITVSTTANTTNTGATLVWGDDESTPLSNAWAATLGSCANLILPGVNPQQTGPAVMLVQSAQFAETTSCAAAGGNRSGLGIVGGGINSTYIVPTPNFSASTCNASALDACFLDIVDGAQLQGFSIWGGGNGEPGSAFTTKVGAVIRASNNASARNVQFTGWGANGINGLGVGVLFYGGGIQLSLVGEDMFGEVGCEFKNSSNQGAIYASGLECYDNSRAALWIAGGSQGNTNVVNTVGGIYGGPNTANSQNIVQITGGGVWVSTGEQFSLPTYGSGNAHIISIGSADTETGTVTGAGTATIIGGMIDSAIYTGGSTIFLNSSTDSLTLTNTLVKNETNTGQVINNSGALTIDSASSVTGSGGTIYSGSGTRNNFKLSTCADTSGSATAQICTTALAFPPQTGDSLLYTTTTANTGALTLAVNGASAAAVQKWLGTALASGDLKANEPAMMTFDGTNWQLGTIGNSPAGSSFTLTTTGISGLATYAGGVLNIPNYSGGGGGNVSSTGTFSTPNDVPTIAGSNTIQDPTGVTITNSTLHASNTFVGPASSYSNATTSLTTVLTSPTIAAGTAVAIHCWGMYSFTTAAEFAELGITTSQTPVSIAYSGLFGYSLVTNTGTAGTTGNGTSSGAIIKSTIITAALSTPYSFQLDGVIVWNASNAGTFALGAATSSTSGTINVGVNQAYCTILP